MTSTEMLNWSKAGFAATGPMTAAMLVIQQQLPASQKEPLEPVQILEKLLEQVGLADELSAQQKLGLATLSHLAYGAAAGGACGLLARRLPRIGGLRGVGCGLALWACGYCGWLPALKILPPPTQRPPGRNELLIIAHLVWGFSLDQFIE